MTETLHQDLPPCPACGSKEATVFGVLGRRVYMRCRACGWDYCKDARDARDAEDSYAE